MQDTVGISPALSRSLGSELGLTEQLCIHLWRGNAGQESQGDRPEELNKRAVAITQRVKQKLTGVCVNIKLCVQAYILLFLRAALSSSLPYSSIMCMHTE